MSHKKTNLKFCTDKTYRSSICTWPDDDRPREKLIKYGEQYLSNSELLAIVLRTGVKGESAVDLARNILSVHKTFRALSRLDMRTVPNVKGMGPVKWAQIRASIEIGRRFREEKITTKSTRIKSSNDIAELLMPRMRDLNKEVFKVVFLNASNRIIDIVDESHGTVNFASPVIREIMQAALQRHAVSVICAHNHPSGDTAPSDEDRKFTRRLMEAGRIMQIRVLDHIIVGNDCYYSFADEVGML